MSVAVFYHSRSGNTKKLAEAAAKALGVQAHDLTTPLEGRADALFLGASLYAGTFDPAVGAFLRKNAASIGAIVCFGSSASGRSAFPKVKALAEELGVRVYPEFFNCPGHFLFLHKNRPDGNDLAKLADFVQAARAKLKV